MLVWKLSDGDSKIGVRAMKALSANGTNYGPYSSIETLPDRYRGHRDDGTAEDLCFSVVGAGSIVDATGLNFPQDAGLAAATAAAVAVSLQAIQDGTDKQTTKADAVTQYLVNHTAAECATYVQTNVTDLASARTMLMKFAMVLSVLARQTLR